MKNEFLTKLQKDEELLFYSISDVSKTSMQLGRFTLGFVVIIFFWMLFIMELKKINDLNFSILLMMVVLVIITVCLIYGFFYNLCLKYKNKNNEYFVTNMRIAIYNFKTGFRIESIFDIEHIGIFREKNNYGDLTFNFVANNLKEQISSAMSFEGIENPRKIVELIISKNKNIHVYDDRPTIMGRKI